MDFKTHTQFHMLQQVIAQVTDGEVSGELRSDYGGGYIRVEHTTKAVGDNSVSEATFSNYGNDGVLKERFTLTHHNGIADGPVIDNTRYAVAVQVGEEFRWWGGESLVWCEPLDPQDSPEVQSHVTLSPNEQIELFKKVHLYVQETHPALLSMPLVLINLNTKQIVATSMLPFDTYIKTTVTIDTYPYAYSNETQDFVAETMTQTLLKEYWVESGQQNLRRIQAAYVRLRRSNPTVGRMVMEYDHRVRAV